MVAYVHNVYVKLYNPLNFVQICAIYKLNADQEEYVYAAFILIISILAFKF